MTVWGYAYLNGSILPNATLLAWIDGTSYASYRTDGTGLFNFAIVGADTAIMTVKGGGVNGDFTYFSYENYTPRLYAAENVTFLGAGWVNMNLNFNSTKNVTEALKIQEISTDNGSAVQYALIYNPSMNVVNLTNYSLQEDISGSGNLYNGPSIALSGTVSPNSTYRKDLTAGFMASAGDELKLVWARGTERLPIDRVEFGNQSVRPDNTSMLDAPAPPIGWCIKRVPTGQDTENCFADFQLFNISTPSPGVTFNIHVNNTGWNLISIPLIGPGVLPTALIDQGLDTTWDHILAYAPYQPGNIWIQYGTGWSSTLNDLAAVNQSIGMWINITSLGDANITVGGSGYSNATYTNITLYSGWNLIGYPAVNDSSYTVGQLMSATGATMVEGFNASATYGTSSLPGTTVMKRGNAYWVNVPSSTTWVVNW